MQLVDQCGECGDNGQSSSTKNVDTAAGPSHSAIDALSSDEWLAKVCMQEIWAASEFRARWLSLVDWKQDVQT